MILRGPNSDTWGLIQVLSIKMMTDEEKVMGGVKVGVNVDIKRSDGRIHSAAVSGVNVKTLSVTVEWFERGETKGKEIELEQILGLNQDLAPSAAEASSVPPSKVQKYVPRPSVLVPSNKAATAANTVSGGTVAPPARRNPVRQSHVILPSNQFRNPNSENQNGAADTMPPPKQVPSSLPPEKSESSKASAQRRRSNAVKEVEKLKENREKRRAQAAKVTEENDQLRNKDPGNPNWEFLQMILDYKDELEEFSPLQDGDPVVNHKISVCIRKRPMSQKELKKKEVDVVTIPTKENITIHQPMTKVDLTKYLENQQFRYCQFYYHYFY